ncbi:MAG: bifunctional adenosylcobinamide kinase/adenosylcobinamide-phosphate guanylyltransferase [Pseudomonadota bacterium]
MSKTSALTLVLGHAASGKSVWAEKRAQELGKAPVYVATSRVLDHEMRAKVAQHAARRDASWRLIECDLDLATLCRDAKPDEVYLIDCATMWLTNLLMDEIDWEAETAAWLAAMDISAGHFLVVSNDIGGGVVPEHALARKFQRMQGALNQRLAAAADEVVLVTAGLPLRLK